MNEVILLARSLLGLARSRLLVPVISAWLERLAASSSQRGSSMRTLLPGARSRPGRASKSAATCSSCRDVTRLVDHLRVRVELGIDDPLGLLDRYGVTPRCAHAAKLVAC